MTRKLNVLIVVGFIQIVNLQLLCLLRSLLKPLIIPFGVTFVMYMFVDLNNYTCTCNLILMYTHMTIVYTVI